MIDMVLHIFSIYIAEDLSSVLEIKVLLCYTE